MLVSRAFALVNRAMPVEGERPALACALNRVPMARHSGRSDWGAVWASLTILSRFETLH